MVKPRRHDEGNHAVALLATAVVVTTGVFLCGVIVLLFSLDPVKSGAMIVGGGAGCVFLVWLLRDRRGEGTLAERYGVLVGLLRPKKKKIKVRVKRVKVSPDVPQRPTGPPTAEQIREISAGANYWVPTGHQKPDTDED